MISSLSGFSVILAATWPGEVQAGDLARAGPGVYWQWTEKTWNVQEGR